MNAETRETVAAIAGRRRRTPRLPFSVPIRVFATDYKGREFVEDCSTVTINLYGAKIRIERELIPEQEIRILCGRTGRESIFRVVDRAGESDGRYSFWGVESTNSAPAKNFWGINFPLPAGGELATVRVMLQCPECLVRELFDLANPLLEKMEAEGGLLQICPSCGRTAHWKRVAYES